MLFNSFEFLFYFLPLSMMLYWIVRVYSNIASLWVLILFSLIFYGYWSSTYLVLLLGSIFSNYVLSHAIQYFKSRYLLWIGVTANIFSIAYFKYAGFLSGLIFSGSEPPDFISNILLPLAISFFTFQQIAYLIDVSKGLITVGTLRTYLLFVTFFPQLIAGPIVRYQQIKTQFYTDQHHSSADQLLPIAGIAIFIIGLSKKVLIADTFAVFANKIFSRADSGYEVSFVDAWFGALAYTFQIYFDFSGYSDMAIGLGLMLGFKLPLNFYSPYRSLNIIEFWRCWHITLSNFFRDYLYIPLGGNRNGLGAQIVNLLIVMSIVGLWHGAGWTFVLWGTYHGFLLSISHLHENHRLTDRYIKTAKFFPILSYALAFKNLSVVKWFFTFFLVVIGWVLFRSESLDIATVFYHGMMMQYNFLGVALIDYRLYFVLSVFLMMGLCICLLFPNSIQIVNGVTNIQGNAGAEPINRPPFINFTFKPTIWNAVPLGFLAYLSISTLTNEANEFLYFNF